MQTRERRRLVRRTRRPFARADFSRPSTPSHSTSLRSVASLLLSSPRLRRPRLAEKRRRPRAARRVGDVERHKRVVACVGERAEMEQCHLILAVFDKRRGGRDVLLGQAPISLASYTSGNTIGFQAPLVLHGVVCGSICCNIQTVWPVDDLALSAW